MKLSSSAEGNQINSKILKNTKYLSGLFPHLISNKSRETTEPPSDWKVGFVIYIHIKANINDVRNNRPISVTSVSFRLIEHVICTNIMSYLYQHNILFKNQHGFRKSFSCETVASANK